MSFDPDLPANGSPLDSAQMRAQLNALKALIDALNSLNNAQVDETNTLPPGNPATATVVIAGQTLHLTFGIPQGEIGPQGPEGQVGPPGEVTVSQMNAADEAILQQTSANTNSVGQLGMTADSSYQQWQFQAMIDKLDEFIGAARRSGGGP